MSLSDWEARPAKGPSVRLVVEFGRVIRLLGGVETGIPVAVIRSAALVRIVVAARTGLCRHDALLEAGHCRGSPSSSHTYYASTLPDWPRHRVKIAAGRPARTAPEGCRPAPAPAGAARQDAPRT